MAVELATGYVSLVPSADGFGASLQKIIGPDLADIGKKAGDDAADGFAASFSSKAKVALGGAGILAGGVLAKGFVGSIDNEISNDKLAAQLGLDPAEASRLGHLAGDVYAGAYGDSLGQVNEAIKGITQNIGEGNDDWLKRTTQKALDLSAAFDQDLGPTTAAVGQLIKTGLAKDSDEAFDIITAGFQHGVDKSGDFLDTLNEYGTQFRKLGLDGTEATGLLSQGLQGGARDADLVADAIKEFSIRAIDGSKLTAEGFKSIGLDAAQMTATIAKGGPEAKAGLDLVLDKLRAVEDPAQRAAAATALFGTQSEDLGQALFDLDLSTATDQLGQVAGAANQMGSTLSDNAGSKLEAFKRKFELATAGIGEKLGPILSIAPGLAGVVTTLDGLGVPLGDVGKKMLDLGKNAITSAASIVKQTAVFLAQKAATIATTVATKAYTAAQWLFNAAMDANPIVLVVIALVALVAGIVIAYKNVEWFRDLVDAAFAAIRDAIEVAFNWVTDNWPLLLAILTGPIGLAVLAIAKYWDDITGAAKAAWDAVVGTVTSAWSAVTSVISTAAGGIVSVVTSAWNAIGLIVQQTVDFIEAVVRGGFDAVQLAISTVIDVLVAVFIAFPARVISAIGDLGSLIWAGISAGFTFLKSSIGGILFDILGGFSALGTGIANFVVDLGATLAGWVLMVWDYGGRVIAFMRDIPSQIGEFFSGLADAIESPFVAAFRKIAHLWNESVGSLSFSIPSWVPPPLGGKGWHAPKIEGFEDGGQTPGGNRPFWVGEDGPELMARSRSAFVMPHDDSMDLAGGGGSGVHIAGNLIVQTNDAPKQWFDEGIWRVAR